jgi:hypothetical protein
MVRIAVVVSVAAFTRHELIASGFATGSDVNESAGFVAFAAICIVIETGKLFSSPIRRLSPRFFSIGSNRRRSHRP